MTPEAKGWLLLGSLAAMWTFIIVSNLPMG